MYSDLFYAYLKINPDLNVDQKQYFHIRIDFYF